MVTMEKKFETAIAGLRFRDITPAMEKQVGKTMENPMETGVIQWFIRFWV